ncbi:MAG: adenylate/guanylate cyclase domain-containing protein [Rhodocyclaceae bacterium]|nr:adenylate/guanylate cyclase domain-containing protein [Rhodocyclaceae bacterium]
MSRTRPAPSTRQPLPRPGQLYALRVLCTGLVVAMLAVNDAVCRGQPGAHAWLLLAGAAYPHIGHLLLGRFAGRRAKSILVIDGLFAGAVIGAIGLFSAPSAVLATISMFNWTIIGGPSLVALGMLAALVGIAFSGAQVIMPVITDVCLAADALAALVLLSYFFVLARFMYRYIGELRQQQAELQAAADAADQARAIADGALLGVLPASAAATLAEQGALPPVVIDAATLLLVEFAWSRGESPAVADLAECFQVCDTILNRHGFEGIKTFGRRYLAMSRAAGGPDAAVAAVRELNNYLLDHRALVTAPAAQRAVRAILHCGAVTAGLVQPARLNFELLGETVEALSSLANLAAAQPMATLVASAAALRKLKSSAGFAATPDGASSSLHVLALTAAP